MVIIFTNRVYHGQYTWLQLDSSDSSYGASNPLTVMNTPVSAWKNMIGHMAKTTQRDFENMLTRYALIPTQVDQFITLMTAAIEKKTTKHASSMVGSIF